MIKHYVVLEFSVDEDDMVSMGINHHLLVEKFGGVAYDDASNKWLSPDALNAKQREHDAEFVMFVSRALYNSAPDGAEWEGDEPIDAD
jgi:hypothetical protein